MKKVLVMCGSGIATSTVVMGKVKSWIADHGYADKVQLYQGKVADELSKINDYDAVISTTMVPDKYKDQVINGVSLLVGRNTEEVYEQLEQKLEENN